MTNERQRRCAPPIGVTLVELITVIAIVAALAALLVPVLSQARKRSLSSTCVSNLKQIGTATAMYIADHDEHMPNGCGTMLALSERPFYPRVKQQLLPYVRDDRVFTCPADTGTEVESTGYAASRCGDSCQRMTGTSYDYFWDGLYPSTYVYMSEDTESANKALFWDAGGHWHSGAPAARMRDGMDSWLQIAPKHTYNVLFWDWHAKSGVTDKQFRDAYSG